MLIHMFANSYDLVNYSQATMPFSGAVVPDAGRFVRNKVIEPPVQNLPLVKPSSSLAVEKLEPSINLGR